MEPRNNERMQYWFGRGTYFGGPFDTQELRLDFVDRLQVLADEHHGDRKRSNRHHFIKLIDQRYVGSHYYRVPALNIDVTWHGTWGSQIATLVEMNDYDLSTRDEALGKLYEKARGQIDLSIDLLQGHQTLALARKITSVISYVKKHPIQALKKSRDYFLKHRRDPAIRGIKDAGSLWLEYVYGLKPTLQTLYDTAVELGRNIEPQMKIAVRSKSKREGNIDAAFEGSSIFRQKVHYQSHTRCEMVCWFRASSDAVDILGQFTSLNPASMAWELLPFSFVADWFVDIGGYMRNLESALLMGNRFVQGYQTLGLKTTYDGLVNHSESDSLGNVDFWDLKANLVISAKFRLPLTEAPFPRAPSFKADLSSGRLLNAAALLTNLLGKH